MAGSNLEQGMVLDGWVDGPPDLSGRGLRFVLVHELRRRRTMTVAEMVDFLGRCGYRLPGRASKVVSDSLRWEVARGRVKRLARGVYNYGAVPKTTARRITLFARRSFAWITATIAGEPAPPTPDTPHHRKTYWTLVTENPRRAPWQSLTWLWST